MKLEALLETVDAPRIDRDPNRLVAPTTARSSSSSSSTSSSLPSSSTSPLLFFFIDLLLLFFYIKFEFPAFSMGKSEIESAEEKQTRGYYSIMRPNTVMHVAARATPTWRTGM
eukprot:766738-Hanusia_phi.AAC.3